MQGELIVGGGGVHCYIGNKSGPDSGFRKGAW